MLAVCFQFRLADATWGPAVGFDFSRRFAVKLFPGLGGHLVSSFLSDFWEYLAVD